MNISATRIEFSLPNINARYRYNRNCECIFNALLSVTLILLYFYSSFSTEVEGITHEFEFKEFFSSSARKNNFRRKSTVLIFTLDI